MDSPRDQLFTGTRFAQDADAGFAGCYSLQVSHQAAHGLAFPHDSMFAQALSQLSVFVFQALQLECVLDRKQQLIGRDGLLQKIERAQSRSPHGHLDVRLA